MTCFREHPLVLLHGFPLDSRMWGDVLEPLSKSFSVINLDLPGFGNRSATSVNSLANWAIDVEHQLRELSIIGPLQLCGLSMGGYVAMEFAAQFPDRLARLILCDTKTEIDAPEAIKARLELAEQLSSADIETQQSAVAKLVDMMPSKLLAPETLARDTPVLGKLRSIIQTISPTALAAAQFAMAGRRDTTEYVTSLDCSVLAVVGQADQLTPPERMQSLVERCRHGSLKIIPSSGHLPPLENPLDFVRVIAE